MQGLIIVGLGIASPVIVADLSWRYLYFITSALAVLAWFFVLAFLPETRWQRSQEELAGKTDHFIYPGENRPRPDASAYGRRTVWTEVGLFTNGFENRAAGKSMIDTVRTMLFPNILWVMAVNGIFISVQNAAAQTGSSALIASG